MAHHGIQDLDQLVAQLTNARGLPMRIRIGPISKVASIFAQRPCQIAPYDTRVRVVEL